MGVPREQWQSSKENRDKEVFMQIIRKLELTFLEHIMKTQGLGNLDKLDEKMEATSYKLG